MGTSTSGAQLGAKFMKLAEGLSDTTIPLNATGLAGKKIFESAAAGTGALGVKPAGKRKAINARYDLMKSAPGGGAVVIAYIGPARLLNNPTAQHFIAASAFGSRKTLAGAGTGIGAVTAFGGSARGMLTGLKGARRRRKAGKRALTIGGGLFAYAFHPGTPGKQFFQFAEKTAVTKLPSIYARTGLTGPLKKAFAA